MKEITKSEHDFYTLSTPSKSVHDFSYFQSLDKLQKTCFKSLNFFHEHNVPLVLILIIINIIYYNRIEKKNIVKFQFIFREI